MKQYDIFGEEPKEIESKYTGKITIPLYEPKGRCPHPLELYDNTKSLRLINEIEASNVNEDEKRFLKMAAMRHNVFNYGLIADYYAHASKEMQHLIERSALVILDFEKAIEYGYVKLSDEIREQYLKEVDDAE